MFFVLVALNAGLAYSIAGYGDQGVITGDPGVGDDQVLVDFSAYGEGSVVEIEGALLVALNEDECREDPRSWGRG